MKLWTKLTFLTALFILCAVFATELYAVSDAELEKIKNAVPTKTTVKPAKPRKLLVFNLCKGFKHTSIPYWDKALVIMGQKTGAYEAVISDDMDMFEAENLNQFDAVCFNNTTKLAFGPAQRETLMTFIKGGKGIIGIHAATDNFYTWPEAAEMMGGQFCGHPWRARGTWAIKIDDPRHPLTAAFNGKDFKLSDEIYRTKPPLYSRVKQRVLMSLDMTDEKTRTAKGITPNDTDIGISWVKSYGKGRLFYCSLGHNHHITWNPAILQHYLDGIQFALGDLPTDTTPIIQKQLEELLAKLAKYDYGQSRRPLTDLSDFIDSAYGRPKQLKEIEKQLLIVLQSDSTPAAKQFICRKLSVIGSEQAVPTLAAMLTNPDTSDMARYALERIPSAAVAKALRSALAGTDGNMKAGIITTLGQRRDVKSVPALSRLIYNSNSTIAAAAAAALGQIADTEAAKALTQAKEKTTGKVRQEVLAALLQCARRLSVAGQNKRALDIYQRLYAAAEPTTIRGAALQGMVNTDREKAPAIIIDVLKSNEPAMQAIAIPLVREIERAQFLKAVVAQLPKLSSAAQVQLFSALAGKGDPIALPAVADAAKSADPSVRIAALDALGKLGDASTVGLLVQIAASTAGEEQKAARNSLYSLRGPEINRAVSSLILKSDPKVKVEVIRGIQQRRIYTATEILFRNAKAPAREVRLESLKALKVIAEPKHLPELVKLLVDVQSEAERKEAEKMVVAVSGKITDLNARAGEVLNVLSSIKDVKVKCSLLSVLGKIGDSNALGVLRGALKDDVRELQTAAIRALSDWPTAEPMADLQKIAQSSDDKTHQTLALRGFIRLVEVVDGSDKEKIELYRRAMNLTSQASEKKLVLAALTKNRSLPALEMAAESLDDAALQPEAEAAVIKIAGSTYKKYPEKSKKIMKKVLEITTDDSRRKKAQRVLDRIK